MTRDPISRMFETGECDHVRPMLEDAVQYLPPAKATKMRRLAKAFQDQKLNRSGRKKSPHADRREEIRARALALREANPKLQWKVIAGMLDSDYPEIDFYRVFDYVQGRFRS